MKKLLYKTAHALLTLFDIIAVALTLPWEYTERHKRNMKEKMYAKK